MDKNIFIYRSTANLFWKKIYKNDKKKSQYCIVYLYYFKGGEGEPEKNQT